uniref:Cytochrome c oxidase subunit 3 n=1 Tax=Samia ricini TaxID=63990 RepID=I3NVX8_SAMRI|nr:cytochrome c oxidase subunit III [Samia ricini]
MKNLYSHPYHLVDYSPWPLTGAIAVMTLVTGLVKWFHNFNMNLLIIGYSDSSFNYMPMMTSCKPSSYLSS